MTQRQLAILFAVSIVVLGLAVWVAHDEHRGSASVAGMTVLPGLAGHLNAVTSVHISGADGKQVTLAKGKTRWMVQNVGYPADSGKLRKLLIDLGNLKAMARKTRLKQNYPLLGVQSVTTAGASGVRIDVVSPQHTWSLIVGHNDEGIGAYVRRVGHKQTLLASPLVMADAQSAQWLEAVIVDIPRKQVRSIEERLAGAFPYRIERAKAAARNFHVIGIPPGRSLESADAANPVASALSNLTLSNVRKAMPTPANVRLSTALFTTFNGLDITVSGYRLAKKGPNYIELTAHGSNPKAAAAAARINARVHGWQYRIPGYSYRQIFQSLAGLLKPLPKPHRAAPGKPGR